VQENLERYGANVFPEAVPRSGLSLFLSYFQSVPVALLAAAAGLSLLTGGVVDATIILGVVVVNAILGYITESRSERMIHSLKRLANPPAWVIRDGQLQMIPAQEMVVGDLLLLKAGSYVPADARLLTAQKLSVDESALTGESLAIAKSPATLTHPDVPLAERTNMVYRGTFVTGGQGRAVVVATGKETEMGKIQTLVGETKVPKTPMEQQLERAGSQLVLLSSAICSLVFLLGLVRGYEIVPMFKTAISLAVAAVPEGLPTVATTTLALGIRTMRKHNVLIRRLDAVEALGSIQTICLDKTGTLTANQMSVVAIHTNEGQITVTDGQFSIGETVIEADTCDELLKLIQICALCNESQVERSAEGMYAFQGSSTENALMQMAVAAGIDVPSLQAQYPRLETNHRSESQNFMATVHLLHDSQKLVAVKGNPAEVLAHCRWKIAAGQQDWLSEADREAIAAANDRLASQALRVLGVAYAEIEGLETAANLPENSIWLGLIGMADPIRQGVKAAIEAFHQAGIDTVMLTGDQRLTACAIGKALNLSQDKPLQILDAANLGAIAPEGMQEQWERVHVFARISPANKLQIIQALQRAGKIVAMTGDGINDAPALKAAEVGIAMGHSGTDVAREVADVVLEDDRLETTIVAVAQGRTIYNNIRKSVHFLLSTNLSEIIVVFLANLGGLGQPLNAIQLLWLNLVTDIFPGLALSQEPPEPDVLKAPPRPSEEPILTASDFKRIVWESSVLSGSVLSAYVYAILRYGISPRASAIAFMSLVIAQLTHALVCRSHRPLRSAQLPPNPYLTVALVGTVGLQLLSFLIPSLGTLLQVTPINLLDGAVIASSALLPLLVNEGTKKF
jgi:Ca2+-transporting ATPase